VAMPRQSNSYENRSSVRDEGSGLTERLARVLSEKRLLLVLDNFERVVEAAQVVADLVFRAPGVKVLVTSRTPLHAYGEREYPLAPLLLPDPTHLPSLERLTQYETVRLFISRAQAVKPDFKVTNENAPAVAEICSRLDGLPLAIELAAAFVKILPPQALLKRLEKRLPLLTGGARTLPTRQQTMRNAIAWSHDLLSPTDQTLFGQLAVFAGGCTIEAAEAVVDPEGSLDVFAGIASLVDKSLLRQEEGFEGEPRFNMLETVREYGLERLAASGEEPTTRERHAGWMLALAEQAEPELFGGISRSGGSGLRLSYRTSGPHLRGSSRPGTQNVHSASPRPRESFAFCAATSAKGRTGCGGHWPSPASPPLRPARRRSSEPER
jgi:predicted ATPase